MSRHDEYRHWPFLTEEEFELACALFDRNYVRAELGPARRTFKIRHRRNATTGTSFIEIFRLISPPDNQDDLIAAFGKLGQDSTTISQMEIDTTNEDEDKVSIRQALSNNALSDQLHRKLCGQMGQVLKQITTFLGTAFILISRM